MYLPRVVLHNFPQTLVFLKTTSVKKWTRVTIFSKIVLLPARDQTSVNLAKLHKVISVKPWDNLVKLWVNLVILHRVVIRVKI